ncbi:MAG: hypothetical protein L0H75_06525 [Nitrosospira sp.]|nr:hypothetical protein [Nitrosospira sp.]MDN5935822.1 hypothetical protein [Nitrosospira sp.]
MTSDATSSGGNSPGWLPNSIPFSGDWDTFIRALYIVFDRDFKKCFPRYRTFPVWHNRRVDRADKFGFEEGFWHLVTRDERVFNCATRRNEKERLPDLGRASRVPWVRPIIEHEDDPAVLAWDFDEEAGGAKVVRSYIWLKEQDYVVVLERQRKTRGDIFLLITSFHITYEAKRRDLQKRYERRRK